MCPEVSRKNKLLFYLSENKIYFLRIAATIRNNIEIVEVIKVRIWISRTLCKQ